MSDRPEPPDLRVSDEQREQAARAIRDHFAAGRLDDEELSERLSAVYRAKTQQELEQLHRDLPAIPPSAAELRAAHVQRRAELRRRLLQQTGGGLAPFLVCTVIWLAGGATGFFWPVFVALVALLPLLRNGWALYGPAPELDRVERHLSRQERHREHHRERARAQRERAELRHDRHRARHRRYLDDGEDRRPS